MSIERLNPTYKEHPVFDAPPPDTVLWRYMDVARFIAFLERRALFFSSIRGFPDRFEGSLTPALAAQLDAEGGQDFVRTRRAWNLASYINCWNEDSHESVALWSLYTSRAGGVAIKASVGSILAALQPDAEKPQSEFYIGRVQYVDYNTASFPSDNAFWPLVHKRIAYRFEHEVRLVVWPRPLVDALSAMSQNEWPDLLPDLAPMGYDIGVDPNLLTEEVVIAPEAPEWLLELLRAVCARYGLGARVSRSDLDSEPV